MPQAPEDSSRQYPSDLKEALNASGVSNIDREKQRAVWDANNQSSVLSVIKSRLADLLLPDLTGSEEGSRDEAAIEASTRQILEDPLTFIKNVCRTSGRIGITASLFVTHEGITENEAREIIDRALDLSGHTRKDIEDILELPAVGRQALRLLQATPTAGDPEDGAKQQAREMMAKIQPPTFDDRSN
jgi:hypothetical protein